MFLNLCYEDKKRKNANLKTCRNIESGEVDFLLGPKLRCRDAKSGVQDDSVALHVARDVAQAGGVAGRDDYDDENEKLVERHFELKELFDFDTKTARERKYAAAIGIWYFGGSEKLISQLLRFWREFFIEKKVLFVEKRDCNFCLFFYSSRRK